MPEGWGAAGGEELASLYHKKAACPYTEACTHLKSTQNAEIDPQHQHCHPLSPQNLPGSTILSRFDHETVLIGLKTLGGPGTVVMVPRKPLQSYHHHYHS